MTRSPRVTRGEAADRFDALATACVNASLVHRITHVISGTDI
jgi:hypothetical protein